MERLISMARLKGITITMVNRVQTGEDDFGAVIYDEVEISVDNVLVAPTSTDDIVNQMSLTGKKAVYTLAIPKGDTHLPSQTIRLAVADGLPARNRAAGPRDRPAALDWFTLAGSCLRAASAPRLAPAGTVCGTAPLSPSLSSRREQFLPVPAGPPPHHATTLHTLGSPSVLVRTDVHLWRSHPHQSPAHSG